MELDHNIHAFDGSMYANSFVSSHPLLLVPRQSYDFNKFFLGAMLTARSSDQPIPRFSPKSSFQKDLLPHRENGFPGKIDSKFPNHINPVQCFNNINSRYNGMEETLDSGIGIHLVTQVSHGAINRVSPHSLVTGSNIVPHPGIEQ